MKKIMIEVTEPGRRSDEEVYRHVEKALALVNVYVTSFVVTEDQDLDPPYMGSYPGCFPPPKSPPRKEDGLLRLFLLDFVYPIALVAVLMTLLFWWVPFL